MFLHRYVDKKWYTFHSVFNEINIKLLNTIETPGDVAYFISDNIVAVVGSLQGAN